MKTEAWILRAGRRGDTGPAQLELGEYTLPELGDHDVLCAPLYGSWEGNMTHALERDPVDVCRLRREKEIILGNSGVVRVLETGVRVSDYQPGDICCLVPNGTEDPWGYSERILGYDASGMMGLLAKQTVIPEKCLGFLPKNSKHSLQQWSAFAVRYATAWENWQFTFGVWKLQFAHTDMPTTYVWSWGGGVGLAEAILAKLHGCEAAMIASSDSRLALLEKCGITAIDRREFKDLYYDDNKYSSDRSWRGAYLAAEGVFRGKVKELTNGQGVSVFVDNVGLPVFRATMRSLGRQGIITTTGWKKGMEISYERAPACIQRYMLLHTHGCRREEGLKAVRFAEEYDWVPPETSEVYAWEDIPQMAEDFAAGKIDSYFPVFAVNPE